MYCSRKCFRAAQPSIPRKPATYVNARPCVGCGTNVLGSGHPARCASCKSAFLDTRPYAEKYRANCHRRRALKKGVASEPYTTRQIAERDGFTCGLCGGAVVMSTPYPDPWSPTIDHVIPLIRGGDDTRANVQLAHFTCNSAKGARVPG